MRAVLLAALITAPLPAFPATTATAATAPASALELLTSTFGTAGVETLAQRGVIVLQGPKEARRLSAVHWKALDELSGATASCLTLTSAADTLSKALTPAAPLLDLSACRALTPEGLMTPSLHALASAIVAADQERWALHLDGAPLLGALGRPNLFDTPWGKDLLDRRHAGTLENPAPLVKPLFDELIAGPKPEREAAALFAAEAAARGVASPEKLIARDRAQGALSEELRAHMRRTLTNERRRWAIAKARSAALALLTQPAVARELEDLRTVATALSKRPGFAATLEAAVGRAQAASATASLRSAGLHLQEPTRLGQYELGDRATVSGAYWVDGLAERASVEVEETLVLDTERGFVILEAGRHKRRNGGPYTYSITFEITRSRPFAVLSLIAAEGTLLSERVEVALARDYELALIKESEAAGLGASCRLKDAEAAYQELETLVTEPAKIKPQYKRLRDRARRARDAAKSDADTLMKLEEVLAASREDSAPQQCRYETGRVDTALKLARRLPAGCDRVLPELHTLRATITRRAVDQSWFMKAAAQGRSRRKSCDLDSARGRWSEALAALEADPAARCGAVAEEESRVKTEFAELARQIAWRDQIARGLIAAETEQAPARRLAILRPITSRLGALDEHCFKSELRRAQKLADVASRDLAAPVEKDLLRNFPSEEGLASAVAEVKAARARRLEAATAVEKVSMESAPAAATSAAEKPAAPVKISPKKSSKRPAKRPARKTTGSAK